MRFVFQSVAALMFFTLTGCVCSTSALVSDASCSTAGCTTAAGYYPGAGCNTQACDIAMNQGFSSGVCFGSSLGGGVKSVLALPLGAASFVGGTVQSFFGCVFSCSHGTVAQSVCHTDPCLCDACGGNNCNGNACSCGIGLNEAAIPVAPPTIPPPAYYEPSPVLQQQSYVAPANCPCPTGVPQQQWTQPVSPTIPAAPVIRVPGGTSLPAGSPPVVPVPKDLSATGATQSSWRFADSQNAISAF